MEKIRAADLVAVIANKTGMTKTAVNEVLHEAADFIAAYVREGRAVTFPGLGKFRPADRKARSYKSHLSGKTVDLPSRRALAFTATASLRFLDTPEP